MKILLISRGFPSKNDPQWGNFELEQATALKEWGHEVVMMSISRRRGLRFHFEIMEYDGIMSYNLSVPFFLRTNFIIPIYILQMLSLWLYKRIIKDGHGVDIIYSHYLTNSILGIPIKDRYKIPMVAIEHWSKITDFDLPFYIKYMGRRVYESADAIISVSSSLKRRIKKHFGRDSIVINNMVSCDFTLPSEKRNDCNNVIHFVSTGSLIKRKGYDILIKAFAQALNINSNMMLSIIGEGSEREHLQELISRYLLNDKVLLLGRKTKAEVIEVFKESDVFVLSSRSETFGVVYIEAMMMGLPVIGTICGGPEEFITNDNGLLVEVNDVDALANALLYMAENISKYDSESIYVKCRECFSSEVIVKQLTECFETVLLSNVKKISCIS